MPEDENSVGTLFINLPKFHKNTGNFVETVLHLSSFVSVIYGCYGDIFDTLGPLPIFFISTITFP